MNLFEKKQKVIFIDCGYYVHKSIFMWEKMKIDHRYNFLNMIIGDLRKIELNKSDIIILAQDSPKGSWRKELDIKYKSSRKKKRESHVKIDWKKFFYEMDMFFKLLEEALPFYQIKIDKLEADDIIAYGVRYYKECEVIIMSIDSDFEQLYHFDNCKIFNPKNKVFKIVKNPQQILSKKIEKETSDDLIDPINTIEEYNTRKKIVSLITLPEFVEEKVKNEFDKIAGKMYNLELIPYKNLRNRFNLIFDNNNVVKYEDSVK